MSSLMSTYRSTVGSNGKGSPKPSSGCTQRSNTSLNKVEPWLDNDSLELISNPGSGKVIRKSIIHPISPEDEVQVFKPAQNGLPLHITNGAFIGMESLNTIDSEGLSVLHRAVLANNIQTVRTLLDNGADINLKGEGGFTPLLAAVRFERAEILKLLLERGADPLIQKDNGMTPLHLAARRGLIGMCSFLLKDPRVKNNLQVMNQGLSTTPFLLACWSGSLEVCELFLRNGADITSKLAGGPNPLHVVSFSGHEKVCELLIETASKRLTTLHEFLNKKDPEGFTPLHYACRGGHERVADLLLRHGADHEAVNLVASASPLHLAAKQGHLSTVELLILYGAVTDIRDGNLRTPLHSAAAFNHDRIVDILVESGADPEAKDALEMTPLLIAVTHGSVQAIKRLVDHGADLKATDYSLNSALHLAIMYRKPEMVKALLELDNDRVLVQMKDKDLKTVLHLACELETSEILEILLENRVCIKGRDISEKIPLHIAAETGSLDCVLALSKFPDFASILSLRDDNGMTALHLAASNKHTKTCELLISKGADVTTTDRSNCTALHLAVKAGSLKTVQVLTDWLLPSTLEEKDLHQNTALHLACRYNSVDVLQYLLDEGADATARNDRNMTCLDVAIEWEAGDVAKTLVKHHRWEEVLFGSEGGNRPMLKLIEKLPDVAEVVLDQCITYSPLPPSHEDFSVKFNMNHLDPDLNLDGALFFAPAIMAKYKREKLLNHVVTQVLLRFKWMMLGKFIAIFNTLVFAIFVILFSCFVVKARDRSTLLSDTKSEQINQKSNFEKAAPVIIFAFLISQFIKEIIQLVWMRLAYVMDPTNVLELVMHGTVCAFILPHVLGKEDLYSTRTQWKAGIVGLLLCYINLTLHFRRFGGLGLYVTMYVEVLFTFVKVICTFMIALIGFSLVFYVLLKHQGTFSTFLFSLGKINVMMTGELDFTDLLVENIVNNATIPGTDVLYVPLPGLTMGLFSTFVLMVSVVLVNLLVGLAVGDIESTQRTASLRALINQTLLVESFMKSYPKFILRRVHKRVYEIKPNRNTLIKRFALAGSDLTDQDFVDKLLNYRSGTPNSGEEWCSHEQMRQERQEETILKLQATVEAQGKILKAMADRLKITEYD